MKRRCYLMLATAVLSGGCMNPGGTGGPAAPVWTEGVKSNIIGVAKFFPNNPWLLFDSDGTGRVDGVKINVYLESIIIEDGKRKSKGVFGSGTIIVSMYRIAYDRLGNESVTLIHKWELDPEAAYPWRCLQRTAMGWGYGLRLQWPGELDVAGREVSFAVKYVREDGRVIASRPHTFLVPMFGRTRVYNQ
ncbi:MAG: hypothetical protein O7D94_10875 [Planctomycetota bacterium]|nr:hypothetical protein [Planctomycetota bacterium]